MKERMYQKLVLALDPQILEIIDVSEIHRGHQGWNEKGESHFELTIYADALQSLSRVQQHQLIYQILAEEMKEIHALVINVLST